MNKLIVFSGVAILLAAGGLVSSLISREYATHTVLSGDLKMYQADLDHDGKIGEHEKNLTWDESYGRLLKETNDPTALLKAADKMGIDKKLSKEERIKLATYEIYHQLDDLISQTNSVINLYSGKVFYLQKKYLKGVKTNIYRNTIFRDAYLDYENYKNLIPKEKEGKQKISVIVGSDPKTLDPTLTSEVQSSTLLENCLPPLKLCCDGEKTRNELGITVKDFDEKTGKTTIYIYLGNYKLKKGKKGEKFDDYEFLGPSLWSDGKKITAKDVIWTLNRAASPATAGPFVNFLENIDGFDEFVKSEKERINKDDVEIDKTYSFYNGMRGISETTGKKVVGGEKIESLEIVLYKNSTFLENGLSNVFLSILPRHAMTRNTGTEKELIVRDWWNYTENNKREGKFFLCCSGAYKLVKLECQKNGKAVFVKNENYNGRDDVRITEITAYFRDDPEAATTSYKNGHVDFNTIVNPEKVKINIETGEIKNDLKDEIQSAEVPYSTYLFFNVNDDALDAYVHKNDDPITGEKKRQLLRKIVCLLINYNTISNTLKKGLTLPTRGVVPYFMKEKYVPKRDKNGKITVDREKENVEWQTRAGYVPEKGDKLEYIFEQRGKNRDKEDIRISDKKPKDEGYQEELAEIRKKNMLEIKKIADSLNMKYDKAPDGSIIFKDFPKISVLTTAKTTNIFEHIQATLKKHGIGLKIISLEFNSILSLIDSGEFCMCVIAYSADHPDQRTFFELFLPNNSNNFPKLGCKNFVNNSFNYRSENAILGFKKTEEDKTEKK